MAYKQLSDEDRYHISTLHKHRYPIQKIASELGRHRSTIYREIKRNAKQCDGGYRPSEACRRARTRRQKSRFGTNFSDEQWRIICFYIKLQWSPEQISFTFKHLNIFNISHQTIYAYIWWDRWNGGELYKHLRQANKIRRKKYARSDSRGVLRGKRSLEERPMAAINRSRTGHYEIDLMHGKKNKDCILTLVDRKSRFLIIKKLKNKSMNEIKSALVPIIHKKNIKTITADNGTEWHAFKDIERLTNVKFYFAKPYHSWERGSNENANGLIRQYIPKGISMKNIDQYICNRIAKRINNRPRKVLQFKSAKSVHLSIPFVALHI